MWPVTVPGTMLFTAPVVGDVDGDGLPDIVVVTSTGQNSMGQVWVFNRFGVRHPHFPKTVNIGHGGVPAIADLNQDGRNKIIITGDFWNGIPGWYDKVWVYDLGGPPSGPIHWGQFMGGPKHQGAYVCPAGPSKAVLTTPTPGSTFSGSTATFSWSAGAGATEYWLTIGTTGVGSNDVYGGSQGVNLSGTVSGLPTNGSPVYVRLWTLLGGASWQFNDYTYTAAMQSKAVLTSPAPGSTLAGSTVTLNRNTAGGASKHRLTIETG